MTVNRPPGPKGHFLTGVISDFSQDQPGFLLDTAQKYGPLSFFRLAHLNVYLLSDSDLIHEVLVKKNKQFEKSPLDKAILGKFLGNGLVTNDGDSHRKQRRLAQPAFHTKRIKNYANTVVEYANFFIDKWRSESTINMADEMIHLTMMIVSKTLFDADAITSKGKTAEIVGHAIHDLQGVSNNDYSRGFSLPNWIPTADNRLRNSAVSAFNEAMESIIDDRLKTAVNGKIEDTGDLLSMLMLSEDEDGNHMEKKQLRDEVATLFAAGHETTSNALAWTWYLLAKHPEVEAKVHEELDRVLGDRLPTFDDMKSLAYTSQVIKESMRLYPPAWILNGRIALNDVEVGNTIIPKGSTIFISPYVMHHLDHHFENPEQFKPERFTPEFEKSLPKFAYMPFGGGPRFCIGSAFAMMEAQLILAAIAQQYSFRLASDQPVVPLPQITMSPEGGIVMNVIERETAVKTLKKEMAPVV